MTVMKKLAVAADIERLETWVKYHKSLCASCRGTCCSLPVEVRLDDLIRMGEADEFERQEPLKQIARRLMKAGVVGHFNHKSGLFTLARRANGDCRYLDPSSRLCTIYAKRPDTCRNHPQIGPRPGYCAWQPKSGGALPGA